MRNFGILLFIALLPALAALGHDLYRAFDMNAMAFKDTGLRFTALGKFWVDYSRDSYVWAKDSVDRDTWKNIIDPLLHKPAALLMLVLPAIAAAFQILALLFGKEGWVRNRIARRSRPRKKGDFTFNHIHEGKSKMKYKRK